MGCFNVSCAVSHITIHEGDRAFLFPLLPKRTYYDDLIGNPDDGITRLGPASNILYPDDCFVQLSFPIEGLYDDYGSLDHIVHNDNTKAIEEFFGITIEQFVALVTENRGKNAYDPYDEFFEQLFTKKELMNNTVSFEAFLLGLGFSECENGFISPEGSYAIIKENETYKFSPEPEKNFLNQDIGHALNNPYDQKGTVLKWHYTQTGSYLGVENKKVAILEKISGMFVHGRIYDKMTQKGPSLESNPDEIRLSKYFLRKFGFEEAKENHFCKDDVLVVLGYEAVIKRGQAEATAYNCADFIKQYKKLTNQNGPIYMNKKKVACDLDNNEFLSYSDEEFLFEDMLSAYIEDCQLFGQLDSMIKNNTFSWKKNLPGLRQFKDWQYFFDIYEPLLLNRKIRKEYIEQLLFSHRMYLCNAMYMPTFQGEQGGMDHILKEILKVAVSVIEEREKGDQYG